MKALSRVSAPVVMGDPMRQYCRPGAHPITQNGHPGRTRLPKIVILSASDKDARRISTLAAAPKKDEGKRWLNESKSGKEITAESFDVTLTGSARKSPHTGRGK